MEAIDKLLSLMQALRDPETGCPWDRQQTIASIKGLTLEEVYELLDAIERNDIAGLRDELGDLLFHVLFYSEMADEQGYFSFCDVVEQLSRKLKRRHPHVFAGQSVSNIEQVKTLWQDIKRQERRAAHTVNNQNRLLDDVGKHMPAIQRTLRLQKRAAGVGFDWTTAIDILDKIEEELNELREVLTQSASDSRITEELGDLLFCCINLARHYQIDSEIALRATNEKFVRRFNYIEETLIEREQSLEQTSLEQMDLLWNEAKVKLT